MNEKQRDIFNNDEITIAVNKANEILAKVGQKVSLLEPLHREWHRNYRVWKNTAKVITKESYNKMKEAE